MSIEFADEANRPVGKGQPKIRRDILDEFGDGASGIASFGFFQGEQQHGFEYLPHAHRPDAVSYVIVGEPLWAKLVFNQHFGGTPDDRDWGAQLMGDIGSEISLLLTKP